MTWLVAMQVLSTGIAVQSALQKGKAKNTLAQMQAQEQLMQLAQEKIMMAERHNERMAQLDRNLKTNEAYFAFLGRDSSDKSYQAFQANNIKVAQSDAKTNQSQSLLAQGQIKSQRQQALYTGQMALASSKVEAFSTAVSGFNNYQQIKVS
tara:strand:+ start:1266 stop:1718 length:453 start_codon:yes stop_codon:yes gene_type:complete